MESLFSVKFAYLIPLFPLIGAILAGALGSRWLKQNSHWPIWIGVGLSALLSFILLLGIIGQWQDHSPEAVQKGNETAVNLRDLSQRLGSMSISVHWYRWIEAGNFKVDAGAFLDPLTAVMLCVVC